jgi:SAM-dependent methyltransferase
VYTKSGASLGIAELSVVNDDVLHGALHGLTAATIAGVHYIRFESGEPLARSQLDLLANHSSALALFEVDGAGRLLPVELRPVAYLDDDVVTIPRYKGKTNEQFTKLLLNVTLAGSAHAADWPGRRLRVLDPVCGRGTTLAHGLVYGFDVDGVEIDRPAYDAFRSFFVTWLKDKRFKHRTDATPLRRDGRLSGRRFDAVFARTKEEYQSDDVQRVRFVNDDTVMLAEHYGKPVFDLVVGDLPYGVQHANRARPEARARDPRELVDAALDGWTGAMKRGAAIGLSWNTKVLERAALVMLLRAHGLEVRRPEDDTFRHGVDHAITRDLIVSVKPG